MGPVEHPHQPFLLFPHKDTVSDQYGQIAKVQSTLRLWRQWSAGTLTLKRNALGYFTLFRNPQPGRGLFRRIVIILQWPRNW